MVAVVVAWSLARIITPVVLEGVRSPTQITPYLTVLAVGLAARVVLTALHAQLGERAAQQVVADLRTQAVRSLCRSPHPGGADRVAPAPSVALAEGLDALGPYVARFLPTLIATCVVTPALVAVTWWHDPIAAYIEVGTLPLIPIFMALVGWATQSSAARRLARSQTLANQMHDLLVGLPTLRYARRATEQTARVAQAAHRFRLATRAVLRQAFLSSLVLEVLATLAVALVAVAVGVRLISGDITLVPALTVLVLAPDVFLPLRQVGQHFHASVDGVAAAAAALDMIDQTARADGAERLPTVNAVEWDSIGVRHVDGDGVCAPHALSGRAERGSITALVGPTGSGKSTAVAAMLGLANVSRGAVRILWADDSDAQRSVDVQHLDRRWWHDQVAWLPQQPTIIAGSLLDNLWLPDGADQSDEWLAGLAERAGLTQVVAALDHGWYTSTGRGGFGLSAGQRHRVALARCLARVDGGATVVVVDEPTAHLDASTESIITESLQRCAAHGCIVLVVAHRPTLIDIAEQVIHVSATSHPDTGASHG